jgi:hypothetical protein
MELKGHIYKDQNIIKNQNRISATDDSAERGQSCSLHEEAHNHASKIGRLGVSACLPE